MSPAIIAEKAAVGSEMNLKVTLSSFGRLAPVVGVLHELDTVALDPARELEGAGADGVGRVAVGAGGGDDDGVAPGEVGEERALGRVEADLDGGVVDGGYLVDSVEELLLGVGRALGHGAVEGEDHVLGGEGGAVVQGDAVAQVEDPGEAVGGDLPALGERRLDGAVVGEAGEALEDVGVDHLVDGGGGAGGGVEVGGLELHADDDVGPLRRGGGGHEHQTRGKRQKSLHLRPSARRGVRDRRHFRRVAVRNPERGEVWGWNTRIWLKRFGNSELESGWKVAGKWLATFLRPVKRYGPRLFRQGL